MRIIKDTYTGLLSFFNYPFISNEIINEIKGPILLHISDTPVEIYNYIFRIIDVLRPQFVIHTGDLADNIKLEINQNRINCYYKAVSKLVDGLERNQSSKIYYALGNHDDYDTVSNLTRRGMILEDDYLTLEDCRFAIGHFHREILHEVDFNLFGHCSDPGHYEKDGTSFLNGLLNINIVDLSNKNVFHLEYPIGTNSARRIELKVIGL